MLTRISVRIFASWSSTHSSQPFQIDLKEPFKHRGTKLMSPFGRKCCSFKNIFAMGYVLYIVDLKPAGWKNSIAETAPSSLHVPLHLVPSQLPYPSGMVSTYPKELCSRKQCVRWQCDLFSFINWVAVTRAVKFYLVA